MEINIMKLIVPLIFASLRIEAKLQLSTTSMNVALGSGSMVFIKHDDNEDIHHCFLAYKRESNDYTVSILLNEKQDFSTAPVFGNRLSNLERNLCGFSVVDVKTDDPRTFRIYANYTDSKNQEQNFNGSINLSVYEHANMKDEIMEVELGTSATIKCGIQNVQKSCTLYDPNGVMVFRGEKRCNYEIKYVTMEHIGNWTCFAILVQSMKPKSEIWELQVAANPSVTKWYKEEGNYGLLGCQYNYFKMKLVSSCQFLSPRNVKYSVSMASASERFTSTGTDYQKAKCQIEFRLPLLDEEIGTWKCMIVKQEGLTGAFVEVHPENGRNRRDIQTVDYPRKSVKYVELGKRLSILCEVPYSTNNCYIKSPTSDIYFGGGFDYFNLGRCTTQISTANSSHLGVWTCHFSREDEADDDIIEVEVIEEYSMESLNKDVEVNVAQSVEMMCRASTPIQSCQYVDPNGLTYNVSPDKKSSGFSYAGRGFEYGECGLAIDSVTEEHDGTWSCIINNKGETKNSLQDTIRIYVDYFNGIPTSTASAIGIPVGIMVVAVLLLGVAFFRRYKKRSPANQRMSVNSDGSNTDVPIFNMQTIVYDTTNNS